MTWKTFMIAALEMSGVYGQISVKLGIPEAVDLRWGYAHFFLNVVDTPHSIARIRRLRSQVQ